MKFEKLKSITKKRKRFSKAVEIIGIIMILIVIIAIIVVFMEKEMPMKYLVPLLILYIIGYFCTGMLAVKERDYKIIERDYIDIRIRDVVSEFCKETENFEIVREYETGIIYIAFHNHEIDYESLSQKLNDEITSMEKITGRHINVKLI